MEYKLTSKYHHSEHCKDGKRRNYLLYFLNGVLIFKHKVPFDENDENGYTSASIWDTYLLNGCLYQKRQNKRSTKEEEKLRNVKFPVSKKRLQPFNIPINERIEHEV